MPRKSLLELQAARQTIGEDLVNASEDVRELAMNGAATTEQIQAAKEKHAQIKERFDILDSEIKAEETAARQRLENHQDMTGSNSGRLQIVKDKAEYIRLVARDRDVPDRLQAIALAVLPTDPMVKAAALGSMPAGGGTGGESFVPSHQLTGGVVGEPFDTNPLRDICQVSNIVGLERAKVAYTLADDGFVDDGAAKEMAATGSVVTFGRNKFKVFCDIAESVLNGPDVGLVNHVENALRSGLATKEKRVSFATNPAAAVAHMSFYQTDEGDSVIKQVEGATMFEAVTNAYADLHELYRTTARGVMRFIDYVSMLKELANGNAAFFQAPPEQILGFPVVFCDSAVKPIVGSFSRFEMNYEGDPVSESDKNIKTGDLTFALTAYFDQHRLLNSAFRLAEVVPEVQG